MTDSLDKPNVLVLVLDALKSSHLSCYGHKRETSPTIDQISEKGELYKHAVSPSTVTIESVGSLFTGLHPGEHRAGNRGVLDVDTATLPEFLHQRGYRTGAVTCNPFLSPHFGFGDGVDEFYALSHEFERGMNMRKFFSRTKHLPRYRRYLQFFWEALDHNFPWHVGNALQFRFDLFDHGDKGARRATERTKSFITEGTDPWFLYTHFAETHMVKGEKLPYRLPDDDIERFIDDETTVDPERLSDSGPEVDYDRKTQDVHERLYDATIHYLDRKISEIVETLKDTGQWEDTLLIVTSDHGECVGERGLIGHSIIYEPGVRVPLVIKPHNGMDTTTSSVDSRVNLVGLYRTIAEVVDESPSSISGANFFGEIPSETMVQDYSATWDWGVYGESNPPDFAYYQEEMKLIKRPDSIELYDLENDPEESNDLAETASDDVTELSEQLQSKLDELNLVEDFDEDVTFDDDVEGRLQKLGYLE